MRAHRLGGLLLVSALSACGDDTTSDGDAAGGGEDAGPDTSAGPSTTTATTSTGTSEGGGGSGEGAAGGQGGEGAGGEAGAGGEGGAGEGGGGGTGGAGGGSGGAPACGTPSECAAAWEDAAASRFDELLAGSPDDLFAFLTELPKGGDLHNHLSGSVYAETFLDWGREDDFCIDTTTFVSRYANQCGAGTAPIPQSGAFYDSIVRAWSMKDFVPGAETGHDHFFATFGKFGAIAGAHRNQSLADFAIRAAAENVVHVETMFNLGRNVGELTSDIWSGTLTAADLPGLHAAVLAHPSFAAELAADVATVESARSQYRAELGCSGANPPAACDVSMRFIAQVSRTGSRDMVFGQLVAAFEMAKETPWIVGANLSSPEDDTTSLNAYDLHMKMLDFLHATYTETEESPLRITLHAGELTDEVLPVGSNHDTFHIRQAIDEGHAERIGHGLDVLSETNSAQLVADMRDRSVLVEVCLSSNEQILGVSGADHPLAHYIASGVPVALATDDLGVSRSSLAGEHVRAAVDQVLSYRQIKRMARDSLEHAFVPGDSLWASFDDAEAVAACAPTDDMGLGDAPSATCEAFLDDSERARLQWELEGRFRAFESQL